MRHQKIVALVPMRHNSERVPGKNYRLLGGKPLFHHIIQSLLNCPKISQIVIDTDSSIIKKSSRKFFPTIKLIDRPKHLIAGDIAMNEILLHDVKLVDADFYLQTHSTNPLLTTQTINQSITTFIDNKHTYDSLFSVTKMQTRIWDSLGRAINHNPAILLRTQDLPPTYEENSNLYIFSKITLTKYHNRIGNRPYLFEIDSVEAKDIDNELDFKIAEFLYNEKLKSADQAI